MVDLLNQQQGDDKGYEKNYIKPLHSEGITASGKDITTTESKTDPDGIVGIHLPNGKPALQRNDGAVQLSRDTHGSPEDAWYYLDSGKKAPDKSVGTIHVLPNKSTTIKSRDGYIWVDESKFGPEVSGVKPGWYDPNTGKLVDNYDPIKGNYRGSEAQRKNRATAKRLKEEAEQLADEASVSRMAKNAMFPEGYDYKFKKASEGQSQAVSDALKVAENVIPAVQGLASGAYKTAIWNPVSAAVQGAGEMGGKGLELYGKGMQAVGLEQAGKQFELTGKTIAATTRKSIQENDKDFNKVMKPSLAGEVTGYMVNPLNKPGMSVGDAAAKQLTKIPGPLGKTMSRPVAQEMVAASTAGAIDNAAQPYLGDKDIVSGKGEQIAEGMAGGAILPPVLKGAGKVIDVGKAVTRVVRAKNPSIYKEVEKLAVANGLHPEEVMQQGITDHFKNVQQKVSNQYKEALEKEGHIQTDMSAVLSRIDEEIAQVSSSMRSDKSRRIKNLKEFRDGITTGENNVANTYELSKTLGDTAYAKSLVRDAGKGGDAGLDAAQAMKYKTMVDEAIDNSTQSMKGHSKEVNELLDGVMADPDAVIENVASELSKAKGAFKAEVAPTRGNKEGGKLLRRFANQPDPVAKAGMIMNADPVLAPKIYNLMDDATKDATRSAFVKDIWEAAKSGNMKDATSLLEKRKHIRNTFFEPGSPDALIVDNLEKAIKLSRVGGRGAIAAIFGAAHYAGLGSVVSSISHLGPEVVGLAGAGAGVGALVKGSHWLDRKAFEVLTDRRSSQAIREAFNSKSQSQLMTDGMNLLRQTFAKNVDPSDPGLGKKVTQFNIDNAKVMKEANVAPLTVSETKAIARTSKEAENAVSVEGAFSKKEPILIGGGKNAKARNIDELQKGAQENTRTGIEETGDNQRAGRVGRDQLLNDGKENVRTDVTKKSGNTEGKLSGEQTQGEKGEQALLGSDDSGREKIRTQSDNGEITGKEIRENRTRPSQGREWFKQQPGESGNSYELRTLQEASAFSRSVAENCGIKSLSREMDEALRLLHPMRNRSDRALGERSLQEMLRKAKTGSKEEREIINVMKEYPNVSVKGSESEVQTTGKGGQDLQGSQEGMGSGIEGTETPRPSESIPEKTEVTPQATPEATPEVSPQVPPQVNPVVDKYSNHKPEIKSQLEAIDKKVSEYKALRDKDLEAGTIKKLEYDRKVKSNTLKAEGEKRAIIQGDSLEPVEGGLASRELEAKRVRENSNYVGKQVSTPDGDGEIVGHAFGKVKVKNADGEIIKYDPKDITRRTTLESTPKDIEIRQDKTADSLITGRPNNTPIDPPNPHNTVALDDTPWLTHGGRVFPGGLKNEAEFWKIANKQWGGELVDKAKAAGIIHLGDNASFTAMKKGGSTAFANPSTGHTYYNLNKLTSEMQVHNAILHEIGGHCGLKNMVGESKWNSLVSDVKKAISLDHDMMRGNFIDTLDVYQSALMRRKAEYDRLIRAGKTEEALVLKPSIDTYAHLEGKTARDIDELFNNRIFAEEVINDIANVSNMKPGSFAYRIMTQTETAIRKFINKLAGREVPITRDQIRGMLKQSTIEHVDKMYKKNPSRITTGDGVPDQIAYHGSSAKFKEFSNDSIGKGVGAQSQGWGHYLTSDKELAEWYRQSQVIRKNASMSIEQKGAELASITLRGSKLNTDKAVKQLTERLSKAESQSSKDTINEAIMQIKNRKIDVNNLPDISDGSLLKADIPDNYDLMDYRKKVSEQDNNIKEKLNKIISKYGEEFRLNGNMTGSEIIEHMGRNKRASEILMEEGVKGIKMESKPDWSDLNPKQHNTFIVFDPKDIKVKGDIKKARK